MRSIQGGIALGVARAVFAVGPRGTGQSSAPHTDSTALSLYLPQTHPSIAAPSHEPLDGWTAVVVQRRTEVSVTAGAALVDGRSDHPEQKTERCTAGPAVGCHHPSQ